MFDSILSTKLYMPRPRAELVPRPRLIEQLEAGLLGRLTLISAAAGAGKTALVSAWVHETGLQAAWVSLDEWDNDPKRFFSYLAAALQMVDENLATSIQATLAALQAPPIEPLLDDLLNQIAQ
jgi:ATP/maltotriose-dependent transcriptional regulator MalT